MTVEGEKFTLKEGGRTYVVHFALNPAVKPSAVDFYKDAGKKERLVARLEANDAENAAKADVEASGAESEDAGEDSGAGLPPVEDDAE